MKRKVIIAAIIVVAIIGLLIARAKAIDYYKNQTSMAAATGNYGKAVDNYSKVLLLNPRSSSDYSVMGMLYYNNGNIEKAIDALSEAVRLDKGNADAHKGLGLIKQDDGDYKGSIKELTLAIKSSPKDVESILARSRAYRMLGDKDKALADVKTVQKLDPKNPAAAKLQQYLQQ